MLTGECGFFMKTFIMAAFCGDVEMVLNLLCMPCTSAANCGMSSNHYFCAFRYSLPPHIIGIMQEMDAIIMSSFACNSMISSGSSWRDPRSRLDGNEKGWAPSSLSSNSTVPLCHKAVGGVIGAFGAVGWFLATGGSLAEVVVFDRSLLVAALAGRLVADCISIFFFLPFSLSGVKRVMPL